MISRNPSFIPAAALLAALLVTAIAPQVIRAESALIGGSLFASAVVSDTTYIMVGDRGKIFLSNDGTKTWEAIESGTRHALSSVCFPDDRNGWIVGQMGVLLHSQDGGKTWKHQPSGVDAYFLGVDFLDPLHGVAVGRDTAVLITTDGGMTWKTSPLKTTAELWDDVALFAVAMIDTRSICAVGDMGRIFITEDGGQSWSETKTSLYDEMSMMGRVLYAVVYDSGTLYAAGVDSTFAFSRDGGKSWTVGDTGFEKPDLFSIDFVGPFGLAAGSGGHVIKTSDGGSTWREVEVPEKVWQAFLSGLDLKKNGSGEVAGLVVGKNGTFGHVVDRSIHWQWPLSERERVDR
jgi:photosystem II stability/assembly factor-like uncharacterized protein